MKPTIRSLESADIIDVGPSVRLMSTRVACVPFGQTREEFEAMLREMGVPFMCTGEGKDVYFNLFAFEVTLFAALRPGSGNYQAFTSADPAGQQKFIDEVHAASIMYAGTSWAELRKRVEESAKLWRKRCGRGKQMFRDGCAAEKST